MAIRPKTNKSKTCVVGHVDGNDQDWERKDSGGKTWANEENHLANCRVTNRKSANYRGHDNVPESVESASARIMTRQSKIVVGSLKELRKLKKQRFSSRYKHSGPSVSLREGNPHYTNRRR